MMAGKNATRKNPLWPRIAIAFPLMMLMSASIVYPYVWALGLETGLGGVLLLNAGWLLLFTVAFRRVKTTVAVSLAALACVVTVAVLYGIGLRSETPTALTESLNAYFNWAGDYLAGRRVSIPDYCWIMAAIYSFAVCYVVAFFTVRKLDALVVSLCGGICFVSLVIIGHTVNLPSLFACILAAALYFLLQNFVNDTRSVYGAKRRGLAAYMVSALPFAAVTLALTILLSTTLTIDPAWMKETRDKLIKRNTGVTDTMAELSGSLSISVTELGGPALVNDEVMMEVTSPVRNVYLKGLSKDVYTGHSWEQSDMGSVSVDLDTLSFDDLREMMGAVPLYGNSAVDYITANMIRETRITVRYKGLKTNLVHLPQKTLKVEPAGRVTRPTVVGRDTLYLQYQGSSPMQYEVTYSRPDRDNSTLIGLLKSCHQGLYGEYWQEYSNGTRSAGEDNQPIMDWLIDRESFVSGFYKQYVQLPANLPQRVQELTAEITGGESNDYDKAKAIETYLSHNYTYTLTPGSYDKSKDFVDEFLFRGKEGYCTYYATAMTVMLRCAGIPARYVEGYVLPGNNAGGVYQVTKRQSHAWVEAYFEGFGWYPFEPTKSFTMTSGAAVDTATTGPTATPVKTPPPPTGSPSAEPTSRPVSAPAGRNGLPLPLLILIAAAGLLALAAVPAYSGARMRALPPRKAAQALFAQYLNLLAAQNRAMNNGEPMKEYAERIALPGIEPEEFLAAAEVFQLARYSPHEITDDQKRLMLAFRLKLLRASRRALGPARYLWYRYIWRV